MKNQCPKHIPMKISKRCMIPTKANIKKLTNSVASYINLYLSTYSSTYSLVTVSLFQLQDFTYTYTFFIVNLLKSKLNKCIKKNSLHVRSLNQHDESKKHSIQKGSGGTF